MVVWKDLMDESWQNDIILIEEVIGGKTRIGGANDAEECKVYMDHSAVTTEMSILRYR